jgi:glycosyltransferase involved in cell wall biosynthesis
MSAGGVSVIVPVRDGARHLGEALESILAQTRPAAEIWVVDDGSRDESAAVAAGFAGRGVRCVSQPPGGAAAARNRGAALATGDFLAFLDADDLWTPDKLACQCAAFETDPALDLVFGHAEQFISPELDAATRARIHCPAGAAPGYLAGAMLVRRAAFMSAGTFETHWELGEFLAWYARFREIGRRERMLDGVVLRRRLHATNQGRTKRAHYPDYARILKGALDRRRRQGAAEL